MLNQKRLSQQLRDFLKRHEDFVSSHTRSSIRETIDVVEYYEEKEIRDAKREPPDLTEAQKGR